MKKIYYFIFGWFFFMMVAMCAMSCSKTYEAPVFWDVKIKQTADTLTAIAYNTKSTKLTYIWHNNGVRSEGIKTVIKPGRNEVQLSVLDDKGNSISEYLNLNK